MPNEKKPKTKCVEYLRHAEYYDMQSTFDELYARSQAGEIFENLMDVILSRENILLAYRAIKKNKGLKSTRVFVFMSTSATESSLFELTYNSSTFTVEHQMLENYTGTAYTTTEGLTDIIGEVKQQAEALNYALIIGGHGTGWNNISDWTDYPNQAKRKAALKTRSFGGLDNTYAINVSSLAQAIETNGIKMQYILFDACYMSNVETAYELKDVTNFLISSSSEVMGEGIPYKTIWSYLCSSVPNYSSAVSGIVNFYKNSNVPYCNMAAIDCRQIDKLASIMKEINSKYTLASDLLM